MVSHDANIVLSQTIAHSNELLDLSTDVEVIGIDEDQRTGRIGCDHEITLVAARERGSSGFRRLVPVFWRNKGALGIGLTRAVPPPMR